jgi:hypothetical protein
MWAWLYATRIPAIRKNKIALDPQASKEAFNAQIPAKVRWKADNYNHLMEGSPRSFTRWRSHWRLKKPGGWRWTYHSPTGSGPEGSSPNETGPEIDSKVHFTSRRPLRQVDIVGVKIARSDAYDLYGTTA